MIAVVALLLLALIPLIWPDPYILRIFSLAAIFSIFAASWDFLTGFTGQINLGHALFFGVAAYVVALLNTRLGYSLWATIPLGALAGIIAGLVAFLPALRLRGFYLALVTLAFPLILSGIILAFTDYTGGEMGISGIDRLASSRTLEYYIIFFIMIASLVIMWKLTDTRSRIVRTGVILHAIREDEITARASGINTSRYKLLAFIISGFFAGIAGALYAHYMRVVGPSTLELLLSFNVILWTIFGGICTIYGAVTGVYILYLLVEFLRLSAVGGEVRFIIQAVLLILVLLFMPQGITTWVRDHIEEECPRCKLVNIATRRFCRGCGASLHPERASE